MKQIFANTLDTVVNKVNQSSYGDSQVEDIIQWAIVIAGVTAVGFIVFAGYQYITSNGEPEKTKKAMRTIIYAAVGLVIVMIAEAITYFIFNNVK